MKANRLALAVPGLILLLVTTVFMACGGNGSNLPGVQNSPEQGQDQQQNLAPDGSELVEAGSEEEALNRVILDVPAINKLGAGEEFTAVISLDLSQDVHQGVLRVLYDEASMTPVEIIPGDMLPSDMVRIAGLDKQGFLPLAFTALPGERNISPGKGDLFRIRFRLEQPGNMAGRISFRSDRQFLQLRNRDGEHLKFDVDSRAGGRDAQ